MTYLVFLQTTADNGYKATSLAMPDCVAVGETRDEALANLRAALAERLAQGEIVAVELGEREHPWLKGFGMFKDDATYEDLLREIEAHRRAVDAAERDLADLSP